MDVFLLLGILIGLPIIVVGGIQYLVFKLAGITVLRVVCAIAALYCAFILLSAYGASPILGNKAAYVGAANGLTVILLLECLAILLWPLGRRYLDWEKRVDARWAAEAEQTMGIE